MPVIRVPSQQDLSVPQPPPPLPVPARNAGTGRSTVGVFSDTTRRGRWRVEQTSSFVHVFGDTTLDLREAEWPSSDIEIRTTGLFGDVKLLVLPGTDVILQGTTILGDQKIDQPTGAPANGLRVTLTANGAFGDVKVHFLQPGEDLPKWWRRKGAKGRRA
ncbi:MAG: hypothetical protein IPM90_12465 [Austwickia sp.]|jgi:hypothetical protein|nr:hypothetical protein [Austwickia sp.]